MLEPLLLRVDFIFSNWHSEHRCFYCCSFPWVFLSARNQQSEAGREEAPNPNITMGYYPRKQQFTPYAYNRGLPGMTKNYKNDLKFPFERGPKGVCTFFLLLLIIISSLKNVIKGKRKIMIKKRLSSVILHPDVFYRYKESPKSNTVSRPFS